VSPDNRFPAGSTVAEQRLAPGRFFRANRASESGGTWARPDRGKWRWSWYKHNRGEEYWNDLAFDVAEIRIQEMNLLKAEAKFRQGDKAGAAANNNTTRTAAGLNATDAAGTNSSCVPKLPNGSCGDLWEMLKWEKRLETITTGPFGVGWFFDGRGWGDFAQDTPLFWAVPFQDLQARGRSIAQIYGAGPGSGNAPNSASGPSVYGW
jgi:hypothetical protein